MAVGAVKPIASDAGTVREFVRLNVWPRYAQKEPATQEQGKWAFNKFILPEIGNTQTSDLDLHHFDAVLARVRSGDTWDQEKGIWEEGRPRKAWSEKTVRKHLFRLGRLLGRSQKIPYNFVEEIETPEGLETEAPILTTCEALSLWMEHMHEPVGPAIFLAAFCGQRKGEALGVRSEDVGRTLLIRNQRVYVRKKGTSDKAKLKTPSSHREIPLPEPYQAILLEMAKGQDRLCHNEGGHPLHPTSVRKMLLRALEESGLPPCSLQSLRATFMSAMDAIGCPRGVLMSIVGHGSQTVTDGYVHQLTGDARIHWLGRLLTEAFEGPNELMPGPMGVGVGVTTSSFVGVKAGSS